MDKIHDYHIEQHRNIYRSTVLFVKWMEEKGCFLCKSILDVGAGLGANINYMSKMYKHIDFTGIELDSTLVNAHNAEYKLHNTRIILGNVYDIRSALTDCETFQGITSFQFLSWIKDVEQAIKQMCSLNPSWIAASTLCTQYDVGYNVEYIDYNVRTEDGEYKRGYQNVYAIQNLKRLFIENGYSNFEFTRFNIDIDIPKSSHTEKKTYTVMTKENERLQISADFFMPWYFIYASR